MNRQVVFAEGTVLEGEYRGKRISVTRINGSYEYEGKRYPSMYAVAKKATNGRNKKWRNWLSITGQHHAPEIEGLIASEVRAAVRERVKQILG